MKIHAITKYGHIAALASAKYSQFNKNNQKNAELPEELKEISAE